MIQVQNLDKWFGPIHAVDDVSFNVDRGEILGFLGPNGAGKSTTMRIITGFLPASGGSVKIDGQDIDEHGLECRAKIGYLPENAPAYPEMSVVGFLHFAAELHGIFGKEKNDAVARVKEMCHLDKVFQQDIDTLSKGYRHRVCLAQALLPDPPILILDEPTAGLDPNQKREVRNLIEDMGQEKVIILSTHILEEVEAVCNRLVLIDNGKLVFDDTPTAFRNRSKRAGDVRVRVLNKNAEEAKKILGTVSGVNAISISKQEEQACELVVHADKGNRQSRTLAAELASAMTSNDVQFDELHTESGRLEEVFTEVTTSETSYSNAENKREAEGAEV